MRVAAIWMAAWLLTLIVSGEASAANVQVILTAGPAPNPFNTYQPGQAVPITVSLRSSGPAMNDVSVVQLDFSLCTAGLVNPISLTIDPALSAGAVTTSGGGQILRWSFAGAGSPLNIPAAPASVVFGTFSATTPLAPGLSTGVNVLGLAVGDGGLTGAYVRDVFNVVWENGDGLTDQNITDGAIAITTFADHPPAKVILSTIATDPSSLAPAGAGLPAGARLTLIGRPFCSPNGSRWILPATTDGPANANDIIIVGSGDSASTAATVVREGTSATWAPGQTVGPITRPRMGILDNGRFIFSGSTTAANPNDHVVKFDGANLISVASEGSPVPGTPDEVYGSDLFSAHLLNDGTPCFVALQTIGSAGNQFDDFCIRGSSLELQQGSVPLGQIGALPLTSFGSNDLSHSADGSSWILDASLSGTAENQVILVNGTVVIQENVILPGSGFASPVGTTGGEQPQMSASGEWFVRGENVDGIDWIMRNGVVIAQTDEPVGVGGGTPTEHFDDIGAPTCFNFMQGSPGGRWMVGGFTDNAAVNFNKVVAAEDGTVVLRSGDGIDFNGNGLVDDGAFIKSVRSDWGFLRDDPEGDQLVIVVDVCDASSSIIGMAMLAVDVPASTLPSCPADIAPPQGNGVVNVQDLLAVITAWGVCANPNQCPADIAPVGGNDVVNVQDLLAVITAWGTCG